MTQPASDPDFYELLGVPPEADGDAIREAYKVQAMLFHPDRNPGYQVEANGKLKAINAAYDVLRDPARRAVYDARPASSAFADDTGRTETDSTSDCQPDSDHEASAKWHEAKPAPDAEGAFAREGRATARDKPTLREAVSEPMTWFGRGVVGRWPAYVVVGAVLLTARPYGSAPSDGLLRTAAVTILVYGVLRANGWWQIRRACDRIERVTHIDWELDFRVHACAQLLRTFVSIGVIFSVLAVIGQGHSSLVLPFLGTVAVASAELAIRCMMTRGGGRALPWRRAWQQAGRLSCLSVYKAPFTLLEFLIVAGMPRSQVAHDLPVLAVDAQVPSRLKPEPESSPETMADLVAALALDDNGDATRHRYGLSNEAYVAAASTLGQMRGDFEQRRWDSGAVAAGVYAWSRAAVEKREEPRSVSDPPHTRILIEDYDVLTGMEGLAEARRQLAASDRGVFTRSLAWALPVGLVIFGGLIYSGAFPGV